MFELLDHYLGRPPPQWPEKFQDHVRARLAKALQQASAKSAALAKAGPSEPLDRYAGTFHDPWYGDLVIGEDAGGLTIDFGSTPRMSGPLRHWQYDTFVTRFTDPTIEPALVTFEFDSDGRVSRIAMKPASPVADFSYDYRDLNFRPKPK